MHATNDEKRQQRKCPVCGQESSAGEICNNCSKKMNKPADDLEIEYKEFTLSEFLEIRKKQEQSGARSSLSDQKGEGFLRKQSTYDKTEKKRKYIILIAVIGFTAVIIGGFFLLKLLIQ
jgi:methionyl-tRNA synthetase